MSKQELPKNSPSVSVWTVTPALAREWLKRVHPTQRRPSQIVVDKYANFMRNGKWKLNNDAISFDVNNMLINGQHRLMAVISSNTAQQMIVGHGYEDNTMVIMDRSHVRSAQQFIHERNAKNIAGIAYYIVLYLRNRIPPGRTYFDKVEPTDQLSVIEDYHDSIERSAGMLMGKGAKNLMNKGFLGFLHWYYTTVDKRDTDLVDEFVYKLKTGVGMDEGDPALTLRNRFASRVKLEPHEMLAVMTKAMQAHLSGRTLRYLRWTSNESFPSL